MSVNLIDKRRPFKPRRLKIDGNAGIHRYPLPPVTDDEEMKFVARAVVWMIAFSVIPMILFHIINYFHPEFSFGFQLRQTRQEFHVGHQTTNHH